MSYKQFHRSEGKARKKRGVYITITNNGLICFSKECYSKFIEGYTSVLYFYDEEKKFIAIKPIKSKTPDSYDIKTSKRGNMHLVEGIAFLRKYGSFHITKGKRYIPDYNEKEELLEIDLSTGE
jgi:hypothetical protein